ncbi:MAG: bacteriophage abortive infection AbiH family protein [Bacteroidales bacterium]|jgi:hypothetical protein|nr:bacteriophage abortive infection AbiH family protein [Bacteroidales bacterium]
MNRIILIGNGFDLAHGLKTSYKDFIDWFWKKQGEDFNFNCKRDRETMPIDTNPNHFRDKWNRENLFFSFEECPKFQLRGDWYKECIKNRNIKFKNEFLEVITKKSMQNWVDIEEEYNTQLHGIGTACGMYTDIELLNKDFLMIKEELEIY